MSQVQLFFVALLPPQAVQDYANGVKQHFAEHYNSRHAQKSPPHITLQPPFKWALERVPELKQGLKVFAETAEHLPIVLENFAAFPPRVIYINVVKTQELLTLQKQLLEYMESQFGIVDPASKTRPFAPHMTVAFRDLTRQNFKTAWQEFQTRSLHFEFTVDRLTLLLHNGQQWNVTAEFPMLQSDCRSSLD